MRRLRTSKRRYGGFTLVELAIAMLVSAILIRLAAPSFANWIGNQRIRTTGEALLHGLNVARSEALRRNARVLFTMPGANGGESAWQVCQVAQGGFGCDGAVPVIQVRDGGEESGNARVGATNDVAMVAPTAYGGALSPGSGVPAAVMFDGRGRLVNAVGWVNTLRMDVRDVSMTTADERRLVVAVSASGGARMCAPLAPAGNPRRC